VRRNECAAIHKGGGLEYAVFDDANQPGAFDNEEARGVAGRRLETAACIRPETTGVAVKGVAAWTVDEPKARQISAKAGGYTSSDARDVSHHLSG